MHPASSAPCVGTVGTVGTVGAGMWSRWGQGLRTGTANSMVARAVDTQSSQSELVYTIGPNSSVAVHTVWRSHNVDVAHLVMVAAALRDRA